MANIHQIHLDKDGYCDGFTVLQDLEENWVEIDPLIFPQTIGQRFDVANMRWLDEYADWYVAPPPEPVSEAEQRELDKEELLIDTLIGQQQIQLSLETGGDSV